MPILTAALLMILQADGGAAPATAPLPEGPAAVMDLIHNIGSVAAGVLVLLLLASLYSWTVILGKMSSFRKATNETRRFLRGFRKASRLQEMLGTRGRLRAQPAGAGV